MPGTQAAPAGQMRKGSASYDTGGMQPNALWNVEVKGCFHADRTLINMEVPPVTANHASGL